MSRIKSLISRADWLQHVGRWQASGMTQAAYSREHKLNATTFNGWITRGREPSSATAPRVTVVPVVVQSKVPAEASALLSTIVLQHSTGWQLTLPADVQITWLARLLNELA